MESLFDNRGFSIRIWSSVTEHMLRDAMEEYGVKELGRTNNDLRIQIMPYKENKECNYPGCQSRALLTVVAGTNEYDYIEDILKFIQFGKSKGLQMEGLIAGETYPYETTPLVYLENVDIFVF